MSRDNFGPVVAQVAAVALMLDYIVTLAIQSAAGVAAIASTFPEVGPWKIHITLAIIVLLSYGNLRGVKEAGKAFALPTYLFVGSMAVVFGIGIYRQFSGTLPLLDVTRFANFRGNIYLASCIRKWWIFFDWSGSYF